MYAREENNEYISYNKLPKEVAILDDNGGVDEWVQLTPENCGEYGFKPLVYPTYNSRTHKRTTTIIEDGDNYTYEVVSLNKTLDDLKGELKHELKGYWKTAFSEGKPYTDYIKATNQTMPTDVETEIDSLYTLLDTIKTQINALDTIEDVLAYELPMDDIKEGLDYLRELI